MSQAYHTRPSELLAVDNSAAAYYLDKAVMRFGQALDAALDEASTPKSGNKQLTHTQIYQARMKVLSTWLGVEPERRFRDPNLKRTGNA